MTGNTPSVVTTLLQPVEIGIVLRSLHTKYLKTCNDVTTTLLYKLALKLVYRVGFSWGMAYTIRLRGRSGFLEIVFVGECEVLVCLGFC